MTRNEFLSTLRTGLAGHVSPREVNRLCAYYDEMILDLIEDGKSESEAVASMGAPNDLVYAAAEKASTPPVHRGRGWLFWTMVVVTSPLWGSLAIAAACVWFVAELMLWSIPLVTGCCSVGFLIGGVLSAAMSPAAFFAAPFYGVTELGVGLALIGGGLLAAWVTWHVVKYFGLAHVWAFKQTMRRREALA